MGECLIPCVCFFAYRQNVDFSEQPTYYYGFLATVKIPVFFSIAYGVVFNAASFTPRYTLVGQYVCWFKGVDKYWW